MRIPILISFILLLISSCRNENKINTVISKEEKNTDFEWYKINTFSNPENLKLEIDVWKKNDEYRLMFSESFDFSKKIIYTEEILRKMDDKIPLNNIKEISMFTVNDSIFFKELTKIKEIQENITECKRKGKRWLSIDVIQNNIHKSDMLKEFVSLFSIYGLKPKVFFVEKCTYIESESGKAEIFFPRLMIKMEESTADY